MELYRKIRWRIALPYTILIISIMVGLTVYLSNFTRRMLQTELEKQLIADAVLLRETFLPMMQSRPDDLDPIARHYGALLNARITIINAEGAVWGESGFEREDMSNHLYRPEIQKALSAGMGVSIRYSQTAGNEMMYVAARADADDKVLGFVRVALPLTDVQAQRAYLNTAFLLATCVATVLAILLGVFIADRSTRPIHQLTEIVTQMAQGDLNLRMPPSAVTEIDEMTKAFNHLAQELQQQLSALHTEQQRLGAILHQMADGILITDATGRIHMLNPAAAEIFETTPTLALNHSFAEVVRHHRLIDLWRQCQHSREEQKEAIETYPAPGRFLQVIISPMPDTHPQDYLVMVQDLTRIRRLETIRRDFISNISHDLRTPLAGLKASVETLEDGACDDPQAAAHFLALIHQEVNTMNQLVEELLELSRIESRQAPLYLQPTAPAELLRLPVERLMPQAQRAGLTLQLAYPPDLPAVLADPERIQRVVINLIHNAIKFTPAGGQITVTAQAQPKRVIFSVKDTGVGIPAEDIARIFERFYKIDRSRADGGTGLGLAIAKHIIQAHDGQIWVESVEGRGSIFSFAIPIAAEP